MSSPYPSVSGKQIRRKLHIAVDRETGNIVASELTASRARDATRVPALLTQIQAPLVSVAADSAYDKEAVYEAIEAHSPGRRTRVVIPPQRNATLSQNSNTAMQEGDVLRSLSKKKMYGSPNSNPSPELGADKENHTSWERYYQVSDCSSSLRNDWYSGI